LEKEFDLEIFLKRCEHAAILDEIAKGERMLKALEGAILGTAVPSTTAREGQLEVPQTFGTPVSSAEQNAEMFDVDSGEEEDDDKTEDMPVPSEVVPTPQIEDVEAEPEPEPEKGKEEEKEPESGSARKERGERRREKVVKMAEIGLMAKRADGKLVK
jgi:hypothetical protein